MGYALCQIYDLTGDISMLKVFGVLLLSNFASLPAWAMMIPATQAGSVECNVIEWDLRDGGTKEPKQLIRTCPLYREGKFGITGTCDFIGLSLDVHVEVISGQVDLISVTKGKLTIESESDTVKLYDARTHHQYLVGCSVRTR